MTTVGATTTTTQTQSQTESATPKTASALSSDFETFLRMLTVQMQNQDPLNPIESTDYAVQLATFSSVEQQVQTNELIGSLGDQLGIIGMSQSASWIGKEVKSDAGAHFTGDPLTLDVTPNAKADEAFLLVRNAAGTEIQRVAFDPSAHEVDWTGLDRDGYAYADGQYNFSVEYKSNGTFQSSEKLTTYGQVQEARRDGSSLILVLEGGIEVNASDVEAVREPS